MRVLTRVTTTLPRATALRRIATRASAIDTLRARRRTPSQTDQPTTTADPTSSQGVYGGEWSSHWESSSHMAWSVDERARSFYSTQIYQGQGQTRNTSTIASGGPLTGLGTGVSIAAQMFGSEVKGNPTESEADVAADRSDEDPLPPEMHHTIRLGAGEAGERPTESEEDVAADLGRWGADPLAAWRK